MIFLIILFSIPSLILLFQLVSFIFFTGIDFDKVLLKILEPICIVIYPMIFYIYIEQPTNDCCYESATFSPDHRFSINTTIFFCIISYFISSYKKEILNPIIEVVINCFLILGLIVNVFISIHLNEYIWLIGNLPIMILFLFQLIKNHQLFIETYTETSTNEYRGFEKLLFNILSSKLFIKFPLLLLLSIPILILILNILLLFGQKPDSIIRAFTETYKHGFSQLDYQCDNVACGGHYLCSVAANGHHSIVNPVRYGIRNGGRIICNRQLLIANAFEDLLQEKFPLIHNKIRTNYDIVGDVVHKYYYLFEIKLISDFVYFLMKPLELIFLFVLYTFDKKPENRIALQYLSIKDKNEILNQMNVYN